MRGLLVFTLRPAHGGDCTNGGVSSRHEKFVVVDPALPEVFETHSDAPALKLVRRSLFGGSYIHAEPVERPAGKGGPMFGGNFIWTSDSRLRSICEYPVPVHDRFE